MSVTRRHAVPCAPTNPRRRRRGFVLNSILWLIACVALPAVVAATELWLQEAKLTYVRPPGGRGGDWSGFAVALSGDTALVGAPYADRDGELDQGVVYVFVRTGGGWSQQAVLTGENPCPACAQGDRFGSAVAISGDTAVIGSPGEDSGGAAYVFTRTEGVWQLQARLAAPDSRDFGHAVALSGETVLVGAPGTAVDGSVFVGVAYVFTRSGEQWTEQAKLDTAAGGGRPRYFGRAVALDGETALVGASHADVDGRTDQGAAYVFTRDGESWSEQAELVAADGQAGDAFGWSTALAGDVAVIGVPEGSVNGSAEQGAAYVFTRSGGIWSEVAELTASDGAANDMFGTSVAMSGDSVVIGAPRVDVDGRGDQGRAYVFRDIDGVWGEQAALVAADGAANTWFGNSVAVDGDTVLAGAQRSRVNGSPEEQGATYAFLRPPPDFSAVRGTVRTLGHCGSEITELGGATVEIVGEGGSTYTLETLENGFYQLPLDSAHGSIDITVSAPGHFSQEIPDVELVAGEIAVVDSDLILSAPCATIEPQELSVTLEPDQNATETLTLGNTEGATTLSWAITTAGSGVTDGGAEQRRPSRSRGGIHATSSRADRAIALEPKQGSKRSAVAVSPTPSLVGVADCGDEAGLIQHDDGSFESGLAGNPQAVNEVATVDYFLPSAYPATLRKVCASFHSFQGETFDFEVVVFDDDGPDGTPGTELGALAVTGAHAPGLPSDFPETPAESGWLEVDVSSLGLWIDSGGVYVGTRWRASADFVFIDVDSSPGNPVGFAGGYWWDDADDVWTPIEELGPASDYRSLLVRVVEDPGGCQGPSTISWLTVEPISGFVPVGGTREVAVGFDTTDLLPGEYRASICVQTNDPTATLPIAVPVTLTVPIPPDFTRIEGTVEGLGYCRADPQPLAGSEVVVGTQAGTYTVVPDENGLYQLAVDPADGPVNLTVLAAGHLPETVTGVELEAGATVTQDFNLLLESPCASVDPESLSLELQRDTSEEVPVTVANQGDATLLWQVIEGPALGESVLRAVGPVTVPASKRASKEASGFARARREASATVSYPFGSGGSEEITISHSSSLDIMTPHTAACGPGDGSTYANQYLRTFTLADFGIFTDLDVTEVTFGVETLTIDDVPITVNLYTLEGEFTYDNLTPIGSTTELLSAQALSLVTVPVTGTAPAGSTLVVEIAAPSMEFLAAFYPGSNDHGETAPSYIASSSCGTPEPITFADLGFPDVHLVMTVTGTTIDCTLPAWVGVDPLGGSVPMGETQEVGVTFDAAELTPGRYTANLCVTTSDSERPRIFLPLELTVTERAVALAFDPPDLDFGSVELDTSSAPMTATLHNNGAIDATGLTFIPPGRGFEADLGACGDGLPAGSTCPVTVVFTPTVSGPAEEALSVGSAEGPSAALLLSGVGLGDGGFKPMALTVDPDGTPPDGNGIFEPGELVDVAPAWRNSEPVARSLAGTASDFTGPPGAEYTLAQGGAVYGLLEPGDTASCLDADICYRLGIDDPLRPATHWEATFQETLDDSDGTSHTWNLHIGDSFADVPRESPFYRSIETLLHTGVTGGCTASEYCPGGVNSRAQMAVFLLKAVEGPDYTPPVCVGGETRFADVPADNGFCPWIEELAKREITSGCGDGNYCPGTAVTRAQMAVFLLKAALGSGYAPPECTGEFSDVPCPSALAAWIEDLAGRGITAGCGADRYCPGDAVSRGQMAAFIARTFDLALYGP